MEREVSGRGGGRPPPPPGQHTQVRNRGAQGAKWEVVQLRKDLLVFYVWSERWHWKEVGSVRRC